MSTWLKYSWCLFVVLCIGDPGLFLPGLQLVPGFFTETCQAQAQRISFVYPSGGQRGTTFEVLIGVRNARQIRTATVSGQGVSVRVIQGAGSLRLNEETERNVMRNHFQKAVDRLYQGIDNPPWFGPNPMDKIPKEELASYPKLEDLRKKRIWLDKLDEDAPGTPEEKRIFLQRFYYEYFIRRPDRTLPDPVSGYLRAEITIDADAPVGWREMYLLGPNGLTAPTVFHVSPCHEVCEIEPNDSADPAKEHLPFMNGNNRKRQLDWAREKLPVQELPVIVNGQIQPGDTDCFFFHAKKDAKLVFVVWGRFLSPYLADGVPGWFSPVISLYDPRGNLVRTADSWRFDPDPVLLFEIPEDGVWRLDVQDALFRGRSDFVYRCAIGEFPFVTARSTLGLVDDHTIVKLDGWNLPVNSIRIPTGAAKSSGSGSSNSSGKSTGSGNTPFVLTVLKGRSGASESGTQATADSQSPSDFSQWLPRPVVFARSSMKVIEKRSLQQSQPGADRFAVTLPVIVEGSISQANQSDCYSFDGKKGEKLVVDVAAIGLDSTMDACVQLLNSSGNVVATNDDRADEKGPNIGLETHHADP
ncbi:MAG: PPC domain-containing protein, partial [Thermoguttaceae bacterium]|nr:PPC domain-containing protein [Thermoguttaceae bacterium]